MKLNNTFAIEWTNWPRQIKSFEVGTKCVICMFALLREYIKAELGKWGHDE